MKVGFKLRNTLLVAVNIFKTRTMPKRVRTPNCTHVDMDRIYAQHQQCFVCGREPSIGFLYECRQDCGSRSFRDRISRAEGQNTRFSKSPLRSELEAAGLSESVIRTAEQGHYTSVQLGTLKAQKLDLKQTIEDSIQGSQINDAVARLAALASPHSNSDGTPSIKTQDTVRAANSQGTDSGTNTMQLATCAFRACHTCRPYYRDRVYISFEAVASADFSPISKDEVQHLPTKSASTLRTLKGAQNSSSTRLAHEELRSATQTVGTFATPSETPHTASTASNSSELTFKTTQTDVDELRALRRPRKRFYNIGHKSSDEIARDLSRLPSLLSRQGLKTAMQAVFQPGRDSSSSGSMITLPIPRSGTVRDKSPTYPVGEFDIGALRRVRRQKEKSDLRRGAYVSGFENVATSRATPKAVVAPSLAGSNREDSRSSDSDFSVYSYISDASEIDIEGGIALTDEALDFFTPNVLAAEIPASKPSVRVRTTQVNNGDDESGGDVGLQSIMAQV